MMYIFTAVDLLLTAIFAILNSKVWRGFAYFVLSLLVLLGIAWGVYLIVQYFTTYQKELVEDYKKFKLAKRGLQGVSQEELEQNEKLYKKEFNKSKWKQKFVKWFIILFCFAVAISFIFGIVFYR